MTDQEVRAIIESMVKPICLIDKENNLQDFVDSIEKPNYINKITGEYYYNYDNNYQIKITMFINSNRRQFADFKEIENLERLIRAKSLSLFNEWIMFEVREDK